jgi:hypothetical protein
MTRGRTPDFGEKKSQLNLAVTTTASVYIRCEVLPRLGIRSVSNLVEEIGRGTLKVSRELPEEYK